MKTPMQEHIEWLKSEHKKYTDQARKESSMQVLGYAFKIDDCIKHAESMLEKEKEAMVDFAYKCRNLMAVDQFAINHWYDKTFVSNVSELVCVQCGGKKDIKFSAMKNFQAYCEDCRNL